MNKSTEWRNYQKTNQYLDFPLSKKSHVHTKIMLLNFKKKILWLDLKTIIYNWSVRKIIKLDICSLIYYYLLLLCFAMFFKTLQCTCLKHWRHYLDQSVWYPPSLYYIFVHTSRQTAYLVLVKSDFLFTLNFWWYMLISI